MLELLLETILELELLDTGAELDDAVPPTIPKGEGCELQVLLEIQLRLLSQPQPLWVVVHSGYSVPYQLHCCPAGALELLDEAMLLDELKTIELLLELLNELMYELELLLELLIGALLLDELETGTLLLDNELLAMLELVSLDEDDEEELPSLP